MLEDNLKDTSLWDESGVDAAERSPSNGSDARGRGQGGFLSKGVAWVSSTVTRGASDVMGPEAAWQNPPAAIATGVGASVLALGSFFFGYIACCRLRQRGSRGIKGNYFPKRPSRIANVIANVRPRRTGLAPSEFKARSRKKNALLSKDSYGGGIPEIGEAERDDHIACQLLHFAGGSCEQKHGHLEERDGSASETEVMVSKSDDEADEEVTAMMRNALAGRR